MLKWFKKFVKKKGAQTTKQVSPDQTTIFESISPEAEPVDIMVEESLEDILADLSPIKFVEYKFTPDEISRVYKTFRKHQTSAVCELDGKNLGQVCIPTGAGKTYIQKYVHVKDMIEKTKVNATGVYVISAHRLMLCSQLFNELIDLVVGCGLKTDLLYIGTGRYPFGELNHKFKSSGFSSETINCHQTTSGEEINKFVEKSRKIGHHVLIVTTYHSFDRMVNVGPIDICTFDEAHITTEDRHRNNIETVWPNIQRKFFFTATRRTFGDNLGQNDVDFYGPVVYEMSPREAVEAGEIVSPRIHIVKTVADEDDIDKEKNVGMLVRTVIESFEEHEQQVKVSSVDSDSIAGKLLVTNSGLNEIQSIIKDKTFIEWCGENSVQVFNFSSRKGESGINFDNNISREESLERMNALKSEERAILFHFDILTEGIDLPAITGVMLLRSTIPLIKLLQNLGRACRLHKDDRKRLYSGEIQPGHHAAMIKPFSWVILPKYINENWEYVERVILKLRESYDIPVECVTLTDLSNTDVDVPPDSVLKPNKPRIDVMQEIEHVFERVEIIEFQQEAAIAKNKRAHLLEYIGRKQQC